MGGILAEPVFIHKNYAGSPIAATQFRIWNFERCLLGLWHIPCAQCMCPLWTVTQLSKLCHQLEVIGDCEQSNVPVRIAMFNNCVPRIWRACFNYVVNWVVVVICGKTNTTRVA